MKKISILILLLIVGCNKGSKKIKGQKEVFIEKQIEKEDKNISVENDKIEIFRCSYINQVSDLGKGILLWDYNCEVNVTFFKDENLTVEQQEFNFCSKFKKKLCPLFYKPDYGIMNFVVLNSNNVSYEIIFNYGEKAFVSKKSSFKYVSWKDFFLKHIETIYVSGINYKVQSYEGDFLGCISVEDKKRKKIKWREKNSVIVDISLLI